MLTWLLCAVAGLMIAIGTITFSPRQTTPAGSTADVVATAGFALFLFASVMLCFRVAAMLSSLPPY